MVLKNVPDKNARPEVPEEEERSPLDVALEYKTPIIVGLLTIAVVVLVVVIFRNMAEAKEAESWSRTKALRGEAVQAINMNQFMAQRMRTTVKGARESALRNLEAQADEYVDFSVHPWLLYYKARLYEKMDRLADARDALAELTDRYKDHTFTNPAAGLTNEKPLVDELRQRLLKRAEFEAKYGKPFSKRPQPQPGLSATLTIKGYGDIKLGFFTEVAPVHVANFLYLAREGYLDGTTFHRITPFCIQGGDANSKDDDPKNDGLGDPGWQVEKEIRLNPALHTRGTLSAAAQGVMEPDSGSQFFICTQNSKFLDGGYTPYGEVLEGMDVVAKIAQAKTKGQNEEGIAQDRPVEPIVVEKVTVEGEFTLPESQMPGKLPAKTEKKDEEKAAEKKAQPAPEKKPVEKNDG